MSKFLGKCLFISWAEADKIADSWAKTHFGPHAKAITQREGSDLSILVSHLMDSDYEAHCAAFADNEEFEAEENFGAIGGYTGICAIEPSSVLLNAVLKSIGNNALTTAKHSVSTDYGIFVMENELGFDDYARIVKES